MAKKKKFKLVEAPMNLVCMPQGWLVGFAISSDKYVGSGLAKLMNDTYHLENRMDGVFETGTTEIVAGNVAALVVKNSSYDAVDENDLRSALEDLREKCEELGFDRVAMPKICTGGNGMKWKAVKKMIKEVFADGEIFVMICC